MGISKLARYLQVWWSAWLCLLTVVVFATSAMKTVSLVDFCGQTLHGDGMVLTSHRDSRRYYYVVTNTDCQLTIQAASHKDTVQFQFRFFLVYSMLRPPSSTPFNASQERFAPGLSEPIKEETQDPCTGGSYVQFYDGKDHTAKPLGNPQCGKSIPRPILSTDSFLTLRLVTRGQQPRVDFVGDFTSLRPGLNASACIKESYFPCRNGKCIPRSLICDGKEVDNCGDGTDQAVQPPAWCKGLPTLSPTMHVESSSPVNAPPGLVVCTGPKENQLPPQEKADKCRPLLLSLAAILGAALLFWCCWNPGWFIWRIGACRFLPGHNPGFTACHLCTCSCSHWETTKVTPEPPV